MTTSEHVEGRRLGTSLASARRAIASRSSLTLTVPFALWLFGAEYTKALYSLDGTLSVLSSASAAALFFLAGLAARRLQPRNDLWKLLALSGVMLAGEDWFFSADSLVHTAGRVLESGSGPMILHTVLAFPSGRLRGRFDRTVVIVAWIGAVIVGPAGNLLFLNDSHNLLLVSDNPQAAVHLQAIAKLFDLAALVATGVVLIPRWVDASTPARRATWPFALTWFCVGWCAAIDDATQALGGFGANVQQPDLVHTVATFGGVLLPVTAVAAIAGLRLVRGQLVERVAELPEAVTVAPLQTLLAGALGDPGLRVVEQPAISESLPGDPLAGADLTGDPRRIAAPVARRGEPLGVLMVDRRLDDGTGILDSALEATALGIVTIRRERARIANDQALVDARRRAVDSAVRERQRVERDLHDGAQQELLGIALDLAAARHRLGDAIDPEVAALLSATERRLGGAVSELRALAHGTYPAALVQGGLDEASAALARKIPGVTVNGRVGRRVDPAMEAAGYFAIAEAVANAVKHGGGSGVAIDLACDGTRVAVAVRDDGRGGADTQGSGLIGLRERIEAHGGAVQIDSPPGAGTVVSLTLPLAG